VNVTKLQSDKITSKPIPQRRLAKLTHK